MTYLLIMDEEEKPAAEVEKVVDDGENLSWGDRVLDPDRPLSPRHRKLAELFAMGKTNAEVIRELGYSDSRVSILKSNSRIRELIAEISERIYQETISARLKKMAEPALNEIDKCLNDRTNRYKENTKQDTAKWVLEKLDGKAIQKHEVSGGVLIGVMDRLDAIKAAGQRLNYTTVDVTPIGELNAPPSNIIEVEAESSTKETPEEKKLREWVNSL